MVAGALPRPQTLAIDELLGRPNLTSHQALDQLLSEGQSKKQAPLEDSFVDLLDLSDKVATP